MEQDMKDQLLEAFKLVMDGAIEGDNMVIKVINVMTDRIIRLEKDIDESLKLVQGTVEVMQAQMATLNKLTEKIQQLEEKVNRLSIKRVH